MNENQQQGYKCYDCQKPFSFSEVKRYCLDEKGIRVYRVLCSQCSHKRFWDTSRTSFFTVLTDFTDNTVISSFDRKHPDFVRHEEEEKRNQQEKLREEQQKFLSLFNCDKCLKPIPFNQEKEYRFVKYKPDTPIVYVSYVKYFLVCPPCWAGSYKEIIPNAIFDWYQIKIERTPTFERYVDYKDELKKQNPDWKKVERIEENIKKVSWQ